MQNFSLCNNHISSISKYIVQNLSNLKMELVVKEVFYSILLHSVLPQPSVHPLFIHSLLSPSVLLFSMLVMYTTWG